MIKITEMLFAILAMIFCMIGCAPATPQEYHSEVTVTDVSSDGIIVKDNSTEGMYQIDSKFLADIDEVKVGDSLDIAHDGKIMKVYPAQFANIISIEFDD